MYCVFLVFNSSSFLFLILFSFSFISFLRFHSMFFSCLCFLCVFFVSAKSLNSKAGLEFKEIRLFPMFLFSKKMKFDLFAKSTVFDFLHKEFSK